MPRENVNIFGMRNFQTSMFKTRGLFKPILRSRLAGRLANGLLHVEVSRVQLIISNYLKYTVYC